jgi:MFS family permease
MRVSERVRRAGAGARAEIAVAATFLVNGMVFASLLPRLPQIKANLDLTDAVFGLALLGGGLGGLVGSVAAPRLMRRIPERRAVVAAGLLLAVAGLGPVLVATAPRPVATPAALALALVLIGIADSVHDVSMNVVALGLQRQRGRSIMGRLHGLWSGGAVLAGAFGALAAARDVSLVTHLLAAGCVAALVQLCAAPSLPRVSTPAPPVSRARGARRLRPWAGVAVVAIAAAFIEGTAYEWSAIYLREWLGAGPGVAGLAPVAVTGAMLVSRLMADRWIERWGAAASARIAGILVAVGAALGLAISALTGSPIVALVGFAVVGWTAAPIYPLMLVAGERLPGAAHGSGVGAVSAMAGVGFLVSPPVVGAVSGAVGLPWALSVIALGGLAASLTLPPRLAAPVPSTVRAAEDR